MISLWEAHFQYFPNMEHIEDMCYKGNGKTNIGKSYNCNYCGNDKGFGILLDMKGVEDVKEIKMRNITTIRVKKTLDLELCC